MWLISCINKISLKNYNFVFGCLINFFINDLIEEFHQLRIEQKLIPLNLVDPGKIKLIRGIAYAMRVAPTICNRLVETAKGILLKFLFLLKFKKTTSFYYYERAFKTHLKPHCS